MIDAIAELQNNADTHLGRESMSLGYHEESFIRQVFTEEDARAQRSMVEVAVWNRACGSTCWLGGNHFSVIWREIYRESVHDEQYTTKMVMGLAASTQRCAAEQSSGERGQAQFDW